MTYQFLPPLSDAEYEALREDIAQNGMRHPILVDEKGKILDGHHRARIAAELGFKPEREVLGGLTEVEKRDVAFKMNIARRHMDTAGKRAAVTASLKADPQLSDRQHGRRTGVSHPTVAGIRAELEAAGRLESFTSRVSADGRERPATQPSQPEPQPVEVDAPFDREGVRSTVAGEAATGTAVEAGDGAGTRIPAPPAAVETPGASVSADASGDSVGADAAGAPTDLDTAGAPVNPLDDPAQVEFDRRERTSERVATGLVNLYCALGADPAEFLIKWRPDAYRNRGIGLVEEALSTTGLRQVADRIHDLADYLDKTEGSL